MSFPARRLLIVLCGVFGAPLVAAAQYRITMPSDLPSSPPIFVSSGTIMFDGPFAPAGMAMPVGGGGASMVSPYYMTPNGKVMRLGTRNRQPLQAQWVIPVGEYGLELADGTRMIGRPAKDWSARIASAFGTVTIPLTQIAHIAPAGKGQFAAYLTNGDRVSGSLVSSTMKFETKFGTLSVAAADIARLRSSNAATVRPVAAGNPGAGGSLRTRRRAGTRGRTRLKTPRSSISPSAGGIPTPRE